MALINTFSLILDILILTSLSIFILKFKIEMLARYVRCLENLDNQSYLHFRKCVKNSFVEKEVLSKQSAPVSPILMPA